LAYNIISAFAANESPAGSLFKAVYIFEKLRGFVTGIVNGKLERVYREK